MIVVDDTTKHSLIMVTFMILGNIFNYLYQLSMAVFLSAEQYGTLFSMTSIFVILLVFSQTIVTSMAKFISKLKAEGKFDNVSSLWRLSLRRISLISIVIFIALAALSPFFSRFLNINNPLFLIIIFSSLPPMLVVSVNWGAMQGLQRFLQFGSSQALRFFLNLGIGVILVYLGFGIHGGLAAIPISFLILLPLSFLFLRNFSKSGNEQVVHIGLNSYPGFALLAIFSITVLTNVDVIFAKSYMNAIDAGNYSAISVLGRIVLYAPMGVSLAIFPKTSELFEQNSDYNKLFIKGVLLTSLIVFSVLLLYGILPEFISRFFLGSKHPDIENYLFPYGVAMGLFSFSFLFMRYLLASNETKVAYPLLVVMTIQITLIVLFHSSIAQLVNIMLVCGGLSIVSLVPFYLYQSKRARRLNKLERRNINGKEE